MKTEPKMIGPYETGRVYCGDCLELMKEIPRGAIVVVTDPPYGIGEAGNDNASREKLAVAKDYGRADWDDNRLPEHVSRAISLGREAVIFGGNYYADILAPSSSWISWDKDNGNNDFADVELAWTSHKRAARLIKWRWSGMLQEPGHPRDKREHPTQKPLGLMRWVVDNYTDEGDVVLDPFTGSGTTGVACVELGREFIGFEIDPEYCALANDRIAAARKGITLREHRAGQKTFFE